MRFIRWNCINHGSKSSDGIEIGVDICLPGIEAVEVMLVYSLLFSILSGHWSEILNYMNNTLWFWTKTHSSWILHLPNHDLEESFHCGCVLFSRISFRASHRKFLRSLLCGQPRSSREWGAWHAKNLCRAYLQVIAEKLMAYPAFIW